MDLLFGIVETTMICSRYSGGMRLDEGAFYWYSQTENSRKVVNMEKISQAYWTKGNPDDAGNIENCIEMHYDYDGYGGQWNDVKCNDKNYALCELRC